MGTKVEAPQPSAQEVQLQKLQLEEARLQAEQAAELRPFLLEKQGLIETEKGLRRLTPEELAARMTPEQRRAQEITQATQERQLAALEGRLPVSPALEADLADQQRLVQEAIARRGQGGGTLGLRAQSLFNRQANLVREEARKGQLGLGQSLLASQGQLKLARQGQGFNQLQGFGVPGLQRLGAFGQAQQPFQFQRGLEFKAGLQSAQNRARLLGGLGQMAGGAIVGGLAGGPIGAGLGAFGGAGLIPSLNK